MGLFTGLFLLVVMLKVSEFCTHLYDYLFGARKHCLVRDLGELNEAVTSVIKNNWVHYQKPLL